MIYYKYFLLFVLLQISSVYADSYSDASLISMIQNVQKKNSIFLDDNINQTRAFDLTTGSTSSTVVTSLITSTRFNLVVSDANSAYDCDWHPTGNWIAAVGVPSIAGAIYNFSTSGTAAYHIDPQNTINHGATLFAVKWHPNGKYLAYAGTTSGGKEGAIVYFNTTTGVKSNLTSSFNINHGATVQYLAWSKDGKYLTAVGNGPSNVDHVQTYSFDEYGLWKLSTATITYTPNTAGQVLGVDWSQDDQYLAIGGTSSGSTAINIQVYYFNRYTQTMHLLPGCNSSHPASIKSIHWHPCNNFLLASGDRANNINHLVYTFNQKNLTLTSSIHEGSISETSKESRKSRWSPDGAYIASGEADVIISPNQFLRIYTFLNNQLRLLQSVIYQHNDDLNSVAWSHDMGYLAFAGDPSDGNTVTLRLLKFTEPIDLIQKKQKKELIKIKNMLASTSAALPSLYETVLSTSGLIDSTLNFSISSLTTVTSFLINGITAASQPSFDWHPSKDLVAVSAADNIYIYSYNNIALDLIKSIGTTQPIATTTPSWDIKFSPNADYLISGGWRDYIHAFDGYNLTQKSSKFDHLFNGIEWDKSGAFLFCCEQRTTPTTTNNDPGQLTLYSFNGTSLTKVTSTGDAEYATQMSINYNNRLVAKGGNQGKVNIYVFDPMTTSTLSFLTSLNELTTSVSTVLFHPTQDILFVNTATQIRAFSINGTFTTELIGCQVSAAGAQFLDFDHTGKYLLVSFSDKFIVFKFNGAILTEVIRYSSGSDVLTGAKWSSDGKKIATLVDTGTTVFLRILQVNFNSLTNSKPNLLQETSQATLSVIFGSVNQLISQNSYAIAHLANLNITTSNSIIQSTALTINTSNALSGLLVQTSQATELLIQNSQAIVSINTLTSANSFAINALSTLAIQNSHAIITQKNLTIATSQAISGLLVATSNAVAGLLVVTSNAAAGLLVATSDATNATAIKALALDMIDTGPSHLHFNDASITMSYNVLLSTDHQLFVHASGVVNGNGHSITFARGGNTFFTIDPAITTTFQNVIFKDYNDASVSIGAGSSFIFGHGCRVELAEPQTLSRTWSFAGQSLLEAHNNSITLGSGANYLSSLINSSLTIANAPLLNVRDNNLRTASNNASLIFNNVQLNLSSDFTYSIGSMIINNDVVLRGTSIFNYSTIMGLTIASQSKLTIDQETSFNYAPADNFRNLLSLADSSATLFFNNATLVATATGPRLINGTLLVDGIMNIQSAAASQAEAVIFGNETPANDLIIKLMPCATINLLSGYLNYANAQ